MKKHLFLGSLLAVMFLSGFAVEAQVSTSLRITVRNDLGNLVENAEVTLYASEKDYNSSQNAVESIATNAKGEARFRNLNPIPYFVDVQKGDLSNEGGGVKIKRLDKGKVNRVTIIIQ